MSGQPERNEPCPCGSGRKFKKCCFIKLHEIQYLDRKRRQQREKLHVLFTPDEAVRFLTEFPEVGQTETFTS